MSAPPPPPGIFKLKIKLTPSQHPAQSNSPRILPLPTNPPNHHHHHKQADLDDEQEDQLASSDLVEQDEEDDNEVEDNEDDEDDDNVHHIENDDGDSLSSIQTSLPASQQPQPVRPPPPPPQTTQPTVKRSAKSKANPQTAGNPPPKKRKTQANLSSQPLAIHHQLAHHLTNEDNDSEHGSYASDQTHQAPKSRTIKLSNSTTSSKAKPSSNMAPLTDAELLSAAGSQYPSGSTSFSMPPAHATGSKPKVLPSANSLVHSSATTVKLVPAKKKKSNLEGGKKKQGPIIPSAPELLPDQRAHLPQQSINRSVSSPHIPPPSAKPVPGTKAKVKKGSKLAKVKNQDPFQPSPVTSSAPAPIARPPPQPRQQHDYSLGPPPPPPVPAFKPFPIGAAPRPQSQFLPAQPLEKRTARVRSWKKVRREVVGISGIPFWVWTYAGDEHSDYATFKQSKIPQPIGTPTSNNETQYFPSTQPSRPASVASSHAKPSPIRNPTGSRASKSVPSDMSAPNLGGPVLPASFRRPPMSIGSPLGNKANDPTSYKASNSQDSLPKPTPSIARGGKSRDSTTPFASIEEMNGEELRNQSTHSHNSIHQQVKNEGVTQLDHHSNHQQTSSSLNLHNDSGIIKLPQLAIPK